MILFQVYFVDENPITAQAILLPEFPVVLLSG
jgi:hypothetical protein